NSASVDFDLDYVDTNTALHIDGLIRFRKTPSGYYSNWYHHQYGFLNDGIKCKDLGSGNYELWILARSGWGHVLAEVEVNQECTVTTQVFSTPIEITNPNDFTDVPLFGNFNVSHGKMAVGTNSPDLELTVDGSIHSKEVKVDLNIPGPDYVFEPEYELRTLKETKAYIEENKHLPEIPSAKEMEANGIDIGDMNMRLLKKIEELTLYQIELLERLEKAELKIQALEND
ncbi:MAG: hypothetical protein AAFY41_04895, partial [Bacteroidota bacterium]